VKVSIVIPVYNEFPTFLQVLARVRNAPLPEGCTREIVVVDDGSTDGTTRLLSTYKDQAIIVHHSVLNFGKGTAIRIGLAKAPGDIILIQDGDPEYDPNDYAGIVQSILDGRADVVYGSRFLGNPAAMRKLNWIANRILTLIANILYAAHLTDEATAYKAFRAGVLRSMKLECRRFEFCAEVTAKVRRMGYRIHEVPVRYNARGVDEGKKSVRAMVLRRSGRSSDAGLPRSTDFS
jgi:glycosyltransferase involved in cell wall biosynthesis